MKLTKRGEGVIYLFASAWIVFYLAVANYVNWPLFDFNGLFAVAIVFLMAWRISRW